MPVQFLSEAEHKSLNRFPSEVSSEDLNRFLMKLFMGETPKTTLHRFFLLSDKELSTWGAFPCVLRRRGVAPSILKQLRAEHNRLGFALQLCCLRYLGFFPEELQLPESVINYVAQQLQLIPELLVFYGKRSST